MKTVLPLCLVSASAMLACGCGVKAVQADSAAEPQKRVYTTGSNIARKPGEVGGVTTVGREAAEDQVQGSLQKTVPLSPGPH